MQKLQKINVTALGAFVRRNAVMYIAFAAAAVTCLIVPPDALYMGYFDFKTLTCLFCVLAVVCALKNINFFYLLAKKLSAYLKMHVLRYWRWYTSLLWGLC